MERKEQKGITGMFMRVGGVISAVLGFIGVFVPLLPTTPFLLLASWLFVRSSPRLNQRLMKHKILGPFLHNYQTGKGISKRDKKYGLAITLVLLTISFIFAPYWWLRVMLVTIAIGVTYHVVTRKTAP